MKDKAKKPEPLDMGANSMQMLPPSEQILSPGPDLFGVVAPPKANGELVFDAPWQGRSFALAVALVDAGVFLWSDFQTVLIEQVPRFSDQDYWLAWLEALNVLGQSQGLVDPAVVSAQCRLLAKQSLHSVGSVPGRAP